MHRKRWPLFGNFPNVKYDTREEELDYMDSYLCKRFNWIDLLVEKWKDSYNE